MPRDIWSLIGMLAAVVLILFLAYWATRWIGTYSLRRSGGTLRRNSGSFSVIGQLSLGRTGQLLLVRLGERCFLLGMTQEQITLIKELDPSSAAQWLAEPENPAAAPAFLDVLKENLRKKK